MSKYLIVTSLFISVIGITASVILGDLLFAISFLWVLINGFADLSDKPDADKQQKKEGGES